jgi:transcriptional regulator with PAS, ATPase and Fis domain
MATLPSGSSQSAYLAGQLCSSRRDPDDAELLEAMVEGASEGLVVLNSDGLILRANRSAAEMIGYDRDRIVGRPIQDVLFKNAFDATFLSEIVATSLAVSRTYDLADGRSILVMGRPAGAARVVLTLRDETGMKQLVRRTQGVARVGKPGWAELRRTAASATDGVPIVTSSVAMQSVRDKALQCATVDSPVLLFGETGTGKGVFAKLIHEASARHSGPLYVVNCAAIPEGLLEDELFGYARGAFTGADPRARRGSSSSPTPARSCSTRSATCRLVCR